MRLAPLLALALFATPTAHAWALSLDAPPMAGARVPFLARACVDGPPHAQAQVRVELRVAGALAARVLHEGVETGGARYGPAFALGDDGRACRDVEIHPHDAAGDAQIVARARPEGGAAKAKAEAALRLETAPVALAAGGADVALAFPDGATLRLPLHDGRALVPHLPGALALHVDGRPAELPPALAWRIAEVRAGAHAGVVLVHDASTPLETDGLALRIGDRAWALPEARLPPGARLLVSAASAPDVPTHARLDLDVRTGRWTLEAHGHALHALDVPPLRAGEAYDGATTRRIGRSAPPAEPLLVAGQMLAYDTPEAGAAPLVALLDRAQRRVLAEWYTLTSAEVADALARAALRGVEVRVLLEGAPVGGVPPEEGALVAALVAHGVDVSFLASAEGFPARYRSQHAKLVVVDDAWVSVSTENPTPSSYPADGRPEGTEGFGLLVRNETLARRLAALVEADLAPWPDVEPARLDRLPPVPRLARSPSLQGEAPLRLEGAWRITPLVSPDAGGIALLEALDAANARVDVAMLRADARFDDEENPFLEALVEAARRGVRVRLLLDGRFADGESEAIVKRLEALAERERLPLAARLAPPERTLHAKLVLVDGRVSYVGSMNWGEAAMRENREVGLLVENATLHAWLGARYDALWAGEGAPAAPARETPAAGVTPLVLLVVLTALLRRRSRRGRGRRGGRG